MRISHNKRIISIAFCAILLIGTASSGRLATAQSSSQYFPETGHTIVGLFLDYWNAHGGLAQYGYPISDELQERSDTDTKTYTVQYFERAVFEHHPENAGTQYEILLTLLGGQQYLELYGPGGASNQHTNTDNPLFFPETKHSLGGVFRTYWENHGGLPQQGYPISDEFQETSQLDGKPYTVQYFERAVFELHSENAGTEYAVLLSQPGRKRFADRYNSLDLPSPIEAGYIQRDTVIGTDTHLFWAEWGNWRDRIKANTKLRSLALKNNRVLDLPLTNGGPITFAASGSIIAWQMISGPCPPCTYSIEAMDVKANNLFTITTGTNAKYGLAFSYPYISWIETTAIDEPASLMLKNLDDGTTTKINDRPHEWREDFALVLNDQYLVWVESSKGFAIRSLNLKTQQIRTVWEDDSFPYYPIGLGLSGRYLLWANPNLILFDLDAGTMRDLHHKAEGQGLDRRAVSNLFVQGNTAVWSEFNAVYGLKLDKPDKIVEIAKNSTIFGYIDHPTVAGNWIVWTFQDHLQAKRVSDAFAPTPVQP